MFCLPELLSSDWLGAGYAKCSYLSIISSSFSSFKSSTLKSSTPSARLYKLEKNWWNQNYYLKKLVWNQKETNLFKTNDWSIINEQYIGVPKSCSVEANLGDFGNQIWKVIQIWDKYQKVHNQTCSCHKYSK